MLDKFILDIFYNRIIPSASAEKSVGIEDWEFNTNFSTEILEKNISYINPLSSVTLTIKDKEKFDNRLVSYCTAMINHINTNTVLHDVDYIYYDGNFSSIIAASLLNVWFNATEEDFKDPIKFLEYRKDFLEDSFSKENLNTIYTSDNINDLAGCSVESSIEVQNHSAKETPYVFTSKIHSFLYEQPSSFELPNISFGISDNKCYVYAVQGKPLKNKEEQTAYEKKINRLLYKANRGVMDDYSDESIEDVSQPHLFALAAFLKAMEQQGVEEIIVKNFYPLRYDSKEIIIDKKLKQMESRRPSDDDINYSDWYQEMICLKNSNDFLQYNINNKYLRLFRRMEHHLDNVSITAFPYEQDNSMHLKLSKQNTTSSDHIINQIYNTFSIEKEIQK